MILLALTTIGVRAVILNNRLTAEEIIGSLVIRASVLLISEEFFAEESQKIKDTLPTIQVVTEGAFYRMLNVKNHRLSKKLI